MTEFKRGDQIVYIPLHAGGDVEHPDCEFGFVTSVKGDVAFCRYWHRGKPEQLRTTANSGGTPADCLRLHQSCDKLQVAQLLEALP